MVVKPSDILKKWDILSIEQEIDAQLRKHPDWSWRAIINIPLDLPLSITKTLINTYTSAGWTVRHNFGDCQREGRWNLLEFSCKI